MRHRLVLTDLERAEHGGLGRAFALRGDSRASTSIENPEHAPTAGELLPARCAFLADTREKSIAIPFAEGESVLRTKSCSDFTVPPMTEFDTRVWHLPQKCGERRR